MCRLGKDALMEKAGLSEEEEVREEQEIGVGFPARQVTYREARPTNKWNPGQGTWPGGAFASCHNLRASCPGDRDIFLTAPSPLDMPVGSQGPSGFHAACCSRPFRI